MTMCLGAAKAGHTTMNIRNTLLVIVIACLTLVGPATLGAGKKRPVSTAGPSRELGFESGGADSAIQQLTGATTQPFIPQFSTRVYKIMPLGTSMTEGENWTASNGQVLRDGTAGSFSSAGWRDWAKKILCSIGISNTIYVGSRTSSKGFLGEYELTPSHEGTGGTLLSDHEAIVSARITTYLPDILVWEAGENDDPTPGRAYWANRFITAFGTAFAAKNDLKILAVSRTPQKLSTGAWDADSPQMNIINGQSDAVTYWQNRGKSIIFLNSETSLRDYWYGCPTGAGAGAWGNAGAGADWYNDSAEITHFNDPGNYWWAMCIVRSLVGQAPFFTVGKRAVTTTLITGSAGALANDYDFPEGFYVRKTTAGDVLQVLTVYGDYVLLNATTFANAQELWDVPIVRIYKNNSVVNGTIVCERMPYGTWY